MCLFTCAFSGEREGTAPQTISFLMLCAHRHVKLPSCLCLCSHWLKHRRGECFVPMLPVDKVCWLWWILMLWNGHRPGQVDRPLCGLHLLFLMCFLHMLFHVKGKEQLPRPFSHRFLIQLKKKEAVIYVSVVILAWGRLLSARVETTDLAYVWANSHHDNGRSLQREELSGRSFAHSFPRNCTCFRWRNGYDGISIWAI